MQLPLQQQCSGPSSVPAAAVWPLQLIPGLVSGSIFLLLLLIILLVIPICFFLLLQPLFLQFFLYLLFCHLCYTQGCWVLGGSKCSCNLGCQSAGCQFHSPLYSGLWITLVLGLLRIGVRMCSGLSQSSGLEFMGSSLSSLISLQSLKHQDLSWVAGSPNHPPGSPTPPGYCQSSLGRCDRATWSVCTDVWIHHPHMLVLIDQHILALVEGEMNLLGAGATDVKAKYDVIFGVSMYVWLVQTIWK